jgi:hypothetical protein
MPNENGQNSSTHSNHNILNKEIESWNGFQYALREENAILFNKMLEEIREYEIAVASKGEAYSAESLSVALIFQQQKMINHLINKLSKDSKASPNNGRVS